MGSQPLLVLAGGLGTRLRAVVSDVPKPLAPVGAKTFLQLLIENWAKQGVREFIFLLHHQADIIRRSLCTWEQTEELRNCTFRTLKETHPLGTGGAIGLAVHHFCLSGPFLVANCDTWLDAGMEELTGVRPCAVAVVEIVNGNRYGNVQIDRGRVVAFEEKSEREGKRWINAGLYHLSSEVFSDWSGRPMSLERELMPQLAQAKRLRAVPIEANFIDIGIPEDYHRFCRWIESGKKGVL